jgi:outer membrane protein assembly factor BamB
MKRILTIAVALLLAPTLCGGDWPTWRGPTSDGSVTDAAVPTEWSATKNVAWKVPVPGIGNSSPVVAGGRVFLTSCIDRERCVLGFDAATGQQLWKTPIEMADIEKMHKNNTPASSTPVTDGKHVWATFLTGTAIAVACLDVSGQRVWTKSLPGFASPHGFCGSPILHGNALIVNGDSDGDAFLAALDKATGEPIWRTARPNKTRSFSVPVILTVNKKPQVVLAGSKSIAGYDPATGEQIWVADSPTDKFVATAVYADGLVIATGTSPVSTLAAIRPDGRGNVTKSHVAWTTPRGAAYVPSPLAVGKNVFVQADNGAATFLEARSGKAIWNESLGRHHDASPLLVNGLIYSLADDGTTYVVKPKAEFELIAKNSIGEPCHATPAIAGGRIFIRSTSNLWCIGAAGDKHDRTLTRP